ncbi:hypothetical protein BC2926_01980 [Bacillus cereus]|nr:hypothetical protein BC2926_01980 [Bacillus cereus]
MNGREFLDYVLQHEYKGRITYEIRKANKQSKLKYNLQRTPIFQLTDLVGNGTSPANYKTIAHELGHFHNNNNNARWFKKFLFVQYTFFTFWIISMIYTVFYCWNIYKEGLTFNTIFFAMSIISVVLIVLGIYFSAIKRQDEKFADQNAGILIDKYLKNALNKYGNPSGLLQIYNETLEILRGEEKLQNEYTYFIMPLALIPMIILVCTIII